MIVLTLILAGGERDKSECERLNERREKSNNNQWYIDAMQGSSVVKNQICVFFPPSHHYQTQIQVTLNRTIHIKT